MSVGTFCGTVRDTFRLWFPLLLPLVCLPLPLIDPSPVSQCGYCVIVIALYWVTEVIPLPVTAIMPVLMFPLFGILSVDRVIDNYATRPFLLFLSSLIVAVGVEKWNLHKRLALKTLTLVGPEPKWLLMGVMFPTWFMSMWISNTATTAMMLPIVMAILLHLKDCQVEPDAADIPMVVKTIEKNGHTNNHLCEEATVGESATGFHKMSEKRFLRLAKTFTLSTAYAANIGGNSTLIGTPPNIIFKRLADSIYKNYGAKNPINFANWMAAGFPLSVVLVILCWFWLLVYAEGTRFLKFWKRDKVNYERVRRALRNDYESLGPMTFPEIMVTIAFVTLAILWVTRNPGTFRGWGTLFKEGYAGDTTPSVMIAVLLFILPARPPRWMRRCKVTCISATEKDMTDKEEGYQPLLDWTTVNATLAWNVLVLIGGGFALADGCEASGFSQWMASHLNILMVLPPWVVILLLTTMVAAFTEVACNGAAVVLFIPLMGEMAVQMGIHPLYFMIPGTFASNLSFLLPAAHPTNAIVFNSGYIRVIDMVRAGFMMNVISIIVLNVGLNTWITHIFEMDTFPQVFNTSRLEQAVANLTTV